jgi:hypothetical protein
MIVLPVRMDDEQHNTLFGRDLNGSDRVPSLLPRFVYSVQTDEASFVFEHKRGQLE